MFSAMGVDLPKADTVFAPRTVIVSILLGTGITLLATVVPARRATRVPPIAAVREGASLPVSRFGARLGPWVVAPLVRLVGLAAAPRRRVAGELAGANAARNPGRTASTAAALTIGLTLVTLVAVLGAGLNASTTSAISDQLRAGYVLDGNQQIPFSAAEGDELARVPGVTAASHVRADKALVQGEETEVTGIDPATIASFYRFAWTKGSDADARPARLGRRAGDQELRRGESPRARRPAGDPDALGREALARRARHLRPAAGAGVAQQHQHQPGDVRRRVPEPEEHVHVPRREGGHRPGARRRGQGRRATRRSTPARPTPKDATKDAAKFLAMLYVLLGFSIVVSLFGMVNTLVLSVFERTRELGMLRAIGMTRRQARRMIRHESVITALIGAALGLGLGVLLAALATQALSQYDVVFSLPVPTLAAFTLVAVLAGVAAAILPARRASRLNVLDALHYE